MTPQSHVNVVAPVVAGREAALRALLESMNTAPGVADPRNAVLPFGEFEGLHFARLVLLDDASMADLRLHGVTPPRLPLSLALIADCDGPGRELLRAMAERCGPGLRRLFGHCEGLAAETDLLAWLLAHDRPVAAFYVNRRGRTVRQVREEAALREALAARVDRRAPIAPGQAAPRRRELLDFVADEQRAGRLSLTPPEPTPVGWWIANAVHAVGVPLLGLLLLPLIVLLAVPAAVLLRWHETHDPEYCPRPDADALRALQQIEDHDPTNQFTALGPVKPGPFRRVVIAVVLLLIDWAARHVFGRGHLGRVQTIHFARWVYLDDGVRVVFTSNYDGGHEAYMDDFINKVGWGLNLSFSNGVGWPRTRWLLFGGSRLEPEFKRYQRRHQVPSQVWYKAYPGLTLSDLERGRRIREGLEAPAMDEAQALQWLRLL